MRTLSRLNFCAVAPPNCLQPLLRQPQLNTECTRWRGLALCRFNETVRKLVEFVRKRDPRWKARETWLADEKARKEIEQAKEIAAERRRKSAARDQLKIAAAAAQAERDRELQEMIDRGEIDGLSESDSSEEEAVE
eukprot:COSAG05_NODE_3518_length_2013_cov_1.932602_3_plen_136_part_00